MSVKKLDEKWSGIKHFSKEELKEAIEDDEIEISTIGSGLVALPPNIIRKRIEFAKERIFLCKHYLKKLEG